MKEIVVISGKGGTGKTSISASFAWLGRKDVVVADCDVDAADMHLLLKPDFAVSEDFYSGELAVIDEAACTNCGICKDICRFDAIPVVDGQHTIDAIACEGCAYCSHICPVDAITMEELNVGKWYASTTKIGNTLVHARLGIGQDNSGKLVAKVKNEAKRIAEEKKTPFVLVDGSPGIGCPVMSSVTGADFVVLVTEPTVSGLHDLERVYQVVKKFRIPAGCIINKYDLNLQKTREIKAFMEREGLYHLADLPYDESFTDAMTVGKTIVEYKPNKIADLLKEAWEKIKIINKPHQE
ncbi:MAG: ATP-binding protein [Bacteroidales bacterium]|nr:ATP-binding protein [Bacteroidales bacterium]